MKKIIKNSIELDAKDFLQSGLFEKIHTQDFSFRNGSEKQRVHFNNQSRQKMKINLVLCIQHGLKEFENKKNLSLAHIVVNTPFFFNN